MVVVTETVRNFEELRVWQGIMDLVECVDRLTASFPAAETKIEISVRLKHITADPAAAAVSNIRKPGKQIHAPGNALEARK